MPKRIRTPREKKELSYARDGRNTYAESRSRAHKAVALRKAKANRSFRREEKLACSAAMAPDVDDVFVARISRRSWKKIPDAPLGEYVAARLASREAGEMNATDRQSDTLTAGRKRARIRPTAFMGGFFRGQNRAAGRLRAAQAGAAAGQDG